MSAQERNQRKRHREGIVCRATARQSHPSLCTHPGRTAIAAEHLNLQSGHSKNVPIFAALLSAVSDGRAKVGTLSRNIVIARRLMVSEGWYIGGGGFVKSPLLWRLLFVLFLPTQEKNLSYC